MDPDWNAFYRTAFRGLPLLKEVNFDRAFDGDRTFEVSPDELLAVEGLDDYVDLIMEDDPVMTP